MRLGRALAAILCAALAAGCGSSAPTRPARPGGRGTAIRGPAGPAPTTLAGYYAQRLRWVTCDKVFRCARLLVPFDYSRPAWRRFSLPVIELPASHPAERIGALLVNRAVPGESGVAYACRRDSRLRRPVRARFDIVGFDPRGVGGSGGRALPDGPHLDTYSATHGRLPDVGRAGRPDRGGIQAARAGLRTGLRAPLRYVGNEKRGPGHGRAARRAGPGG